MQMQHTVHETHILKIMSFISSRVNPPGSIRKLSLTIIISRSRSATATWWLSVEVLTDNLMTSFINPEQTFFTLQLYLWIQNNIPTHTGSTAAIFYTIPGNISICLKLHCTLIVLVWCIATFIALVKALS